VIGTGLLLIGLGGMVGDALVRGSAGWPQLVADFAIVGAGVGLVSPMLGSATMSAVPIHRGGMAGGAVNAMRQLGYAFGVALIGTVFASRAAAAIADRGLPGSARLARDVAGGQARAILDAAPSGSRAAIDHALHAASVSVSGLQSALGVGGIAGLAAGLLVLIFVRPASASQAIAGSSLDDDRTARSPAAETAR
jgi:hypothetical protein